MKPAARMQSAIDLLDEIIAGALGNGASADRIASAFFKSRRYMGSKDRRAVRELAYRAIRRFGHPPDSARAAMIGLTREDNGLSALFDGSPYGPPAIGAHENAASGTAIPSWITDRFDPAVATDDYPALLGRAPLDIRFDPAKTSPEQIAKFWPDADFSAVLPCAARLPAGTQIEQHDLWQSGALEIQDWGSQGIVAACPVETASLAIDLCAGAGGKSLGLAAAMTSSARLIASDTDRRRLSRLEPRQRRAGVDMIEAILLDPGSEWEKLGAYASQADLVLVDAPCSGSGTWRRNPETRWRLTPEGLEDVMVQQRRLLDLAARLVRTGGYIVYAVCSLVQDEGAGQIARFLSEHGDYHINPITMQLGRTATTKGREMGLILTPHHDGTDGFFMSRLQKS